MLAIEYPLDHEMPGFRTFLIPPYSANHNWKINVVEIGVYILSRRQLLQEMSMYRAAFFASIIIGFFEVRLGLPMIRKTRKPN
jgi:hypothetical protein